MSKATMVIFNPVIGRFLPRTQAVTDAVRDVMRIVGEDEWKAGFRPDKAKRIIQLLAERSVHPVEVTGVIRRINEDTTTDGKGNEYKKVRIFLDDALDPLMVSLEASDEITLFVIQALTGVEPGETITFSPWYERVERNGRVYFNHRCALKRPDGVNVPLPQNVWKNAQAEADKVTASLRAQNQPSLRSAINALSDATKVEFHLQMLRTLIAPKFSGA